MSTWFVRLRPRDDARTRLFCFSSAGAGASAYARWPEHLPTEIDTWAVQLPGRETRLREQPMRNLSAIADEVTRRIEPHLDRPFAFFGHSMGALVAFETSKRLRERGKLPVVLFVSAREAPHLSQGRDPIDELPDDEFIGAMDRLYGGVPALLKENEEFRAIYLPPLRADVTAVSRYRDSGGLPLECPIVVMGGVGDRSASRESLYAWERHTTARFGVQLFPGDHFYLNSARAAVLSVVAAELADAVGSDSGRRSA